MPQNTSDRPEDLFEYENGPGLVSRLFYGVGNVYIIGLASGGLWGLCEGCFHKGNRTYRIAMNQMLNTCNRRGSLVANNLGTLGLIYNVIHGGYLRIAGSEENTRTRIGSIATSGFLFRISRGIPRALLFSLIGCGCISLLDLYRHRRDRISIQVDK
jgi:mitochondrial import inner membrane translocase subunit TIM23